MTHSRAHSVRNGIRLVKTTIERKSKFGGKPNLPDCIEWPLNPKGGPLDFLAQIHCPDLPNGTPLPSEGTLVFFYDLERSPWGHNQIRERPYWRVIYSSDTLWPSPRSNPRRGRNKVTRECFLDFKSIDQNEKSGKEEFVPYHQMLGKPYCIQSDNMAPGKLLLLQLDSDYGEKHSPGWMWGDVGIMYFWIKPNDLKIKRFDRVAVYVECC